MSNSADLSNSSFHFSLQSTSFVNMQNNLIRSIRQVEQLNELIISMLIVEYRYLIMLQLKHLRSNGRIIMLPWMAWCIKSHAKRLEFHNQSSNLTDNLDILKHLKNILKDNLSEFRALPSHNKLSKKALEDSKIYRNPSQPI